MTGVGEAQVCVCVFCAVIVWVVRAVIVGGVGVGHC